MLHFFIYRYIIVKKLEGILMFDNQKKRIDNIRHAEGANKKYYKRVRISDYISGQAIYNLGDYPARVSAQPTEYDVKLVKSLAEKHGLEIDDNELFIKAEAFALRKGGRSARAAKQFVESLL